MDFPTTPLPLIMHITGIGTLLFTLVFHMEMNTQQLTTSDYFILLLLVLHAGAAAACCH